MTDKSSSPSATLGEAPLDQRYQSSVWPKEWQEAIPMELEPFFTHWINQLTAQGLHYKADIATVLSILSYRIARCREAFIASTVSERGESGLLRQLVLDCQNELATYIVPDSGISEHEVVNRLLGRLDGPQSRAALASAPSATRTITKDDSPPWTRTYDAMPPVGIPVDLILECGSELMNAVLQTDGTWSWRDSSITGDTGEYWRPIK